MKRRTLLDRAKAHAARNRKGYAAYTTAAVAIYAYKAGYQAQRREHAGQLAALARQQADGLRQAKLHAEERGGAALRLLHMLDTQAELKATIATLRQQLQGAKS